LRRSKQSSTGARKCGSPAPNLGAVRSPARSWWRMSSSSTTKTPAIPRRSARGYWRTAGPLLRLTKSRLSSNLCRRSISPRPESWPGTMHNVLVTGGSRGIGLAIARRLAAAGYHVIAVARRESDELKAAIDEAVKQGRGVLHFRPFDLSEIDAIPAFVKNLRDEFGAIYGLVNNAGLGTEGLLATMHNSEIEALLRLNVLSPILLTKYVVRHMMADGAGGRVVNMSSIIASTGYNGLSVYGATKAGATGVTRSLPREVGKLGITVNAIAPGFIDTELTHNLGLEQRQRIAGRSALRRLPETGDVASMLV